MSSWLFSIKYHTVCVAADEHAGGDKTPLFYEPNNVELGMRYFPRCSRVLNKIVDDDSSEFTGLEHITSEERKRRYQELQDEMMKAFSQDKEEFPRSALSPPSSKPVRAVRPKVAKK